MAGAAVVKLVSRRGRPTAGRVAEIDAAIHHGAVAEFLNAGFAAAGMDSIAATAGVSKGTLYARFDSKEALFRAVMDSELAGLRKRMDARTVIAPAALEPRLRRHAAELVKALAWDEYRRVISLLEAARPSFPEFGRMWEEMAPGHYAQFLAKDMQEAAVREGLPDADWDFLARLFMHSVEGWLNSVRPLRAVTPAEILEFYDKVIDTIMTVVHAAPAKRA